MRVILYVDPSRGLVGGLNDPSKVELPTFVQNDDVDLVLQGVEKNPDDFGNYYVPAPLPFTTIKAGVYNAADAPPKAGTIRLQLVRGENDPPPPPGGTLPYDATAPFGPATTKPELQTLLNAIQLVTDKGGVKVLTDNQAPNIFRVRWNNPEETAVFRFVENLLEPVCSVSEQVQPLPNGQMQVLKMRQRPLAFTSSFSLPTAPVVTAASSRVGTGTRNCVQTIMVPTTATGAVHFVFANLSTAILPVASLQASTIASALNDLYTDGRNRFTVNRSTATVYYVEFVGPLEKQDFPVLGVEMHDQEPLQTPTARLPLDWLSLELEIDAQKSITRLFEIEITDAEGRRGTPIQLPVTIVNDAIDGDDLVNSQPWLVPYDPEVPYDPDNAVVMLPGAYNVTLGDPTGTAGEPIGRTTLITHNLGTQDLLTELHETGDRRNVVHDDLYVLTKPNDDEIVISFPAEIWPEPPTAGQYRLVISSVKPLPMALPPHHHEISDVNGLEPRLQALEAGENPGDLWPMLPEDKLPNRIPWYNLLEQLRFDAPMPTELLPPGLPFYSAGPPPGIYVTLPGPPPQTVMILDANGQVPVGNLPLGQILDALRSGSFLLPGTIPITVPPIANLLLPPTVTLRDGAAALPPTLPRALPDFEDVGTADGALPLPTPEIRGTVRTVGSAASAEPVRYRGAQQFGRGAKVGCDGSQYFRVFVGETQTGNADADGDGQPDVSLDAFPEEMEVELCTVHVAPKMLAKNCRFTFSGQLGLALTGPAATNVRASYLLQIFFGKTTGPLLSTVQWDDTPALSETLILGDAAVIHSFGVAVQSHKTTGALSAQAGLYERNAYVAAPAGSAFVMRAKLTRFDLEDVPPVQGQVQINFKGNASVLDLGKIS